MGCITNDAYRQAAEEQASAIRNQAYADTAIFTALALWQRNSSSSITNMQMEIANRQLNIAEAVAAHAQSFWPYEINLLDDAFGETKAEPQHAGLSASWAAIIDDTLRRGRTDWLAEMRGRCLSPSRCEAARWDRVAQNNRADIISHADRQAEVRAEALNDRRYARQLATLALGRGQLMNVASYQQIAGVNGAQAQATLVGLIDGARTSLGYALNRERHDGWGAGIQDTYSHRMPYAVAPAAPAPVQVQVQAAALPPVVLGTPLTPVDDPCGPEPPPGPQYDEAWNRWNACKGNK